MKALLERHLVATSDEMTCDYRIYLISHFTKAANKGIKSNTDIEAHDQVLIK